MVAGLGAAALLARIEPPEPTDAVRRAALALVAVVAAAVIVVGAVHARSWWDSFTSPTVAELPNAPNRFTEAGANYRWTWWNQAWRALKAHPANGTGAGSFRFTNLRYRETNRDITTGCTLNGKKMSGADCTFLAPVNPRGVTPMTVTGVIFTLIVRPTIFSEPP